METRGTIIGNTPSGMKALPAKEDIPGRNVIINGNFPFWQRGTTAAALSDTEVFRADRFAGLADAGTGGSGAAQMLQSTSIPDNLSDYSLRYDVTTGDTMEVDSLFMVRYRAEGFDMQRFGFGTTSAQKATLSFWVRSPKTGTHCVVFKNSAQDRHYISEYVISTADTWEKETVTFTGDDAGTWLTNNGIGLEICWILGVGSNYHGSADAWTAGDKYATSNQVNVIDNAANDFHLSRIKLEPGDIATDFEYRPYTAEELLCFRYYERHGEQANMFVAQAGFQQDAAGVYAPITFHARKRAEPTVSIQGTWSADRCGQPSITFQDKDGYTIFSIADNEEVVGDPYSFNTNSTDDYVEASAEF